jgi:hypothetical protein
MSGMEGVLTWGGKLKCVGGWLDVEKLKKGARSKFYTWSRSGTCECAWTTCRSGDRGGVRLLRHPCRSAFHFACESTLLVSAADS